MNKLIKLFVNEGAITALIVIILVIILCILAILFVPIKDAFLGVPYLVEKKPKLIGSNEFYIELVIPCNRIYQREIGFKIDPAIKIQSIVKAQASITGNISVTISQGEILLKKIIELSASGWNVNKEGVWSKVVLRYDPIGSILCGDQKIVLDAKNINIDLKHHDIMVYVSRDRRP